MFVQYTKNLILVKKLLEQFKSPRYRKEVLAPFGTHAVKWRDFSRVRRSQFDQVTMGG